jgi:glycosyltransferase involved in cell wall biosynthesis
MDRHRIAILIPALNESATIAGVVAKARIHGMPIVVDDASHDSTGALAEAAGAVVVRHAVNRGYDGALNSGASRASALGCEYFITIDADGQHDPTVLDTFIAALDQGADVAAGVRDRRQRFGETVFAWVGKALWGLRDPLCGLKAYRTSVYRDAGVFDSYGSIGTQLLLFAARQRKRIVQIDILTRDRIDAPRFGRRLSANLRILRACWIGLRGSPPRPPERDASRVRDT